MRPTTRRVMEGLAVAGIFALDRLTKVWARLWLEPRYAVKVLPFFHLTYVENTGAAWGMLRGANRLLIGVSLLLLGILLRMKRRWPRENLWAHCGAVLVAGGALGNLYDRLTLGYVVDFFDFLVWPVFNVADSCITVGAFCLAWGLRDRERAGPAS